MVDKCEHFLRCELIAHVTLENISVCEQINMCMLTNQLNYIIPQTLSMFDKIICCLQLLWKIYPTDCEQE